LRRVRAILDLVDRGLTGLAAMALCAMMLSISADAAGRYLFERPFQGNYELTGLYLMVMVVYLLLSANQRDGQHVRLDFLADRLKRRLGPHHDRLVSLVSLAAIAPLAWFSGVEAAHKIAALETAFGPIPFPLYLSYVWLPLGAGLLSLRLLLDLLRPADRAG
jgi:TRAP-type C4-dicarboxylate transport system permease small subunit